MKERVLVTGAGGFIGRKLMELFVQKGYRVYGWDKFEHIIFADNLSKEEADKIETLLIALYQTTNHDKGYNIAVGGNVHVGIGENNPFYRG